MYRLLQEEQRERRQATSELWAAGQYSPMSCRFTRDEGAIGKERRSHGPSLREG